MYHVTARRLDAANAAAHEATERLVAAWNRGVQIPSAPDATTAEPEATPDPYIAEWLEQWDEAGRLAYGQKARQLARSGLSGPEVVAALDRQRAGLLS